MTEIVEVVKNSYGFCVITDSEPTIRTIQYRYGSSYRQFMCGDDTNGYHRLKLPYVRMLIGLHSYNNGLFQWNKCLWTFGSIEPYTDMDQLVFVLPMPNTTKSGAIHCCGMSVTTRSSIELVVTEVIESYWSSVFTYWCDYGQEKSFRPLKVGASSLKKLQLLNVTTLAKFRGVAVAF